MTTLDVGIAALRSSLSALRTAGGRFYDVYDRTIDVQINRLRRKIERDPANPVWLQTVRGVGYRLSVE